MHGRGGACVVGRGVNGCWGACVVAERGACVVAGGCGCRGLCVVAGGVCMVARGCMVAEGHAWLQGGMRGCQGACMVVGWCVCLPGKGDMHGCLGGMWLPGGMCGCGGHAWLPGGAWLWVGGGGMHRIRRDTVNEWAVRILLECILVCYINAPKTIKRYRLPSFI